MTAGSLSESLPVGGKKIFWAVSWSLTWSETKTWAQREQAACDEQHDGEDEAADCHQAVESLAAHVFLPCWAAGPPAADVVFS